MRVRPLVSFASFASFVLFALAACRPSTTSSTSTSALASASASAASTVVVHPPAFHRAAAAACAARPPSPSIAGFVHDDPAKPPSPKECATDADCTKGKNGRCVHEEQSFRGTVTGTSYRCSYDACDADADCGSTGACLCRGALGTGRENVCVRAFCKTDSDCGGSTCSPSNAVIPNTQCRSEGVPYSALRCHGPNDECADDSDCTKSGADCAYSEAKSRWVCDTPLCLPD